jgi:hypothetical protein
VVVQRCKSNALLMKNKITKIIVSKVLNSFFIYFIKLKTKGINNNRD